MNESRHPQPRGQSSPERAIDSLGAGLIPMRLPHLTPILNVSGIGASIAWFQKLGWKHGFTWNDG